MYLLLGSIENIGDNHHQIEVVRNFTAKEYEEYINHNRYVGFHLKNKNMYRLIVRNGDELEKFLEMLNTNQDREEDNSPDYVIFEANRLLMNYLSMIRTYDDHISTSLSDIYGSETKDEFKSFLSNLYDKFFVYRFLVRLRNYAQHFDIPITNYTQDIDGNYVSINKNSLLKYDGWSTVKKELRS